MCPSRWRVGPATRRVDGTGGPGILDHAWNPSGCVVVSGQFVEPYSGRRVTFARGTLTSRAAQIDHVVALGDAWQTGAQRWTPGMRRPMPMTLWSFSRPTAS